MAYQTCCIDTCTYSHSNQKFFKFPLHNVALLYEWLKALDFDNSFDITENALICSAHFKNDDFILENGSYDISPTAIPSKFGYEVSKLNEETYISNTYSNNRTNTVGDSTVLNFGTEYEIHLMPNCVGTSSLTQNKSDENDNQGVSHQIIPYTGINNDQNELIYSGNSTKNNNRNQTSLSIYPSSLESANKPQIEISNPRSIGKSNLYQETNHDLDNPDYWMPVKHRSKTNLSNKYSKKLRLFVNAKNRLISKVKKLESRKQNLLDIQLKYLTLRKRVLETENILLVNGFDTSKYSAFRLNNDLETSNNVEHEMSSGDININLSTNKNSISHPASSFSEVLPSAEDENFIL